jgi:hypothetical protein
MPDANDHEQAAVDAIRSAEEAGPDESAAGQVYATVAVAEAILALRAEVNSLKIRLS